MPSEEMGQDGGVKAVKVAPLGEHVPVTSANIQLKRPLDVGVSVGTLNRTKQQSGRETVIFIKHAVLQQHYGRQRIANALIKVPGIISLTYNINKNYCIVRGKRHVSSETFGLTVANLGYEVSLVFKNEKREEILVPIHADTKDGSALKENFPDYLPEEEDEPSISENAICKNSKGAENNASWWGNAKNFVQTSFYW